jgi:hypothetical protein
LELTFQESIQRSTPPSSHAMVDRTGMVAQYSMDRAHRSYGDMSMGDYTMSSTHHRLSKPSYYSHSDALAQESERQRLANRLSGANSRSSSHYHQTPRSYPDPYAYSDAQYALTSRPSRSTRVDDQPVTRIKVDRATGAVVDVSYSRGDYDGVGTPSREKKSSKSSKTDDPSKKKKKSGGNDADAAHSDNCTSLPRHPPGFLPQRAPRSKTKYIANKVARS